MKPLVMKYRRLLWSTGAFLLLSIVLDLWVFPLPVEKLHRPAATFVYSREGRMLSCFTSSDRFWRRPVPLKEISPRLIEAVLCMEDRWFYYHPGVNPVALAQAAVDNLRAGHIKRGGSTITMQIARMIEPKERTYASKAIEILRALQLELHYSKDELLELYFNLAPYGGNIEGVGAATYFYFEKEPSRLSWSEAAILTAIPASPTRFRPDRDRELCRNRRDRVLETLHAEGVIDDDLYASALEETLPQERVTPPASAPHYSQWVSQKYRSHSTVRSTLNHDIQTMCEQLVGRHHARLAPLDINNLAVVVLDNRRHDLLAMVGSADFTDEPHSGQINGALAKRSPGSALKPFVYALGLEQGLISPSQQIEDIPVNYSGYQPDNYDEQFHGLVTVRDALVNSYNVPAVNLTSRIGLKNFYDMLRSGGLTTIDRKPEEYGLPLVLGACEVQLLDLTNLYATVASSGYYRPVSDTIGAMPSDTGRQLLSEQVCYVLSDLLSGLKRPDLPTAWESTADMPRVAWKTGTSYGRKDAWSIGYNPRFTVGVWAGNFDGAGSADIVGAAIATPLMIEIFHELVGQKAEEWFAMPKGVGMRRVCALSGKLPGPFCSETREELYIEGVSPIERCDLHQRILVDRSTGYRHCAACSDGYDLVDSIVVVYPSKTAGWLALNGIATSLPEHNPKCRTMLQGDAPVIVSPEDNASYEIASEIPRDYQQILLQASVQNCRSRLHWFLNGEHYRTVPSGQRLFYPPQPGSYRLTCVDDQGRASSVRFSVK